jgi:hypothetical protein
VPVYLVIRTVLVVPVGPVQVDGNQEAGNSQRKLAARAKYVRPWSELAWRFTPSFANHVQITKDDDKPKY